MRICVLRVRFRLILPGPVNGRIAQFGHHVTCSQKMAGAGEDSRALFGAGVRAALEAWPALQVCGTGVG